MNDETVTVPVYVPRDRLFGHLSGVTEQAALSPQPWRRSDAMTKYLVMKREARRRDWDRYHIGVVIKP